MEGQRLLFVKLVILFVGHSSAEHCDRATTAQVREGNFGQSGDFNWLGILHVHIHEEGKIYIAMTGIVLIKTQYALANADDMVRIPQHVFNCPPDKTPVSPELSSPSEDPPFSIQRQQKYIICENFNCCSPIRNVWENMFLQLQISDSKVMFLATRNTPWVAKPKSFVTHPEYEYSTLNTIAIVELNLDDTEDFPLNPICIPTGETFNTSRYLYLTGFTDENQKMEKVIYNIQYLDKKVCEEFYNRAGLSSQKRIPSAYLCGYAPSNVTQCIWDNGMVLVSNVTGYFHLIGFGIHGPGCAAPARFIDLFPYLPWIKSITTPDEVYDDAGYRRKEDANKGDDEFIPIHELITENGSRLAASTVYKHEFERYSHFKIRPGISKSVLVFAFNDTWEEYEQACKGPKALMYKENFELKALTGTTTGLANL